MQSSPEIDNDNHRIHEVGGAHSLSKDLQTPCHHFDIAGKRNACRCFLPGQDRCSTAG